MSGWSSAERLAGQIAVACLLGLMTTQAPSQFPPSRIQIHRCMVVNDTGIDLKVAIAGFRAANAWPIRKGGSQMVDLSNGEKVVIAFDAEKQTIVGDPLKVTIKERTLITLGKNGHTSSPIKAKVEKKAKEKEDEQEKD